MKYHIISNETECKEAYVTNKGCQTTRCVQFTINNLYIVNTNFKYNNKSCSMDRCQVLMIYQGLK